MNIQLLKSKKFRAAIIAAITSVLSFAVAKLGLNMNVEETITLLTAVMSPFLIYIGAEGYSEADAKRVAEENKVKQAIIDQINKEGTDEKA